MSDFKPEVSPKARTVVYFVGLAWGTLATLVTAIAAVWWPDHATQILATVGGGSSAVAFLAGGLGVMYRPTTPANPVVAVGVDFVPDVADISGGDVLDAHEEEADADDI